VQLNTLDADAAALWYLNLWPSAHVTEVAGMPAVAAEMLLLFRKVDQAPPGGFDVNLGRSEPQSAFWHIGAFTNTTGLEARLDELGIQRLLLRQSPDDDQGVWRSGVASYPGVRSLEELATEPAADPRPGGFAYVLGPDNALVELTGGPRTTSSLSHVHFFHARPLCAANWYVEHLGMELPPVRQDDASELPRAAWDPCDVPAGEPTWPSLERQGTIRQPRGGVRYGNGSMSWYPPQCVGAACAEGFAPSRGQVLDHVAFEVEDFDGLYGRLRAAGVRVLEPPHPWHQTRAFMIEDPDGLAIELVEAG